MALGTETIAPVDMRVGPGKLPTRRAARYTGGRWVGKFIKTRTYPVIPREGSRPEPRWSRRASPGKASP